MKNYCSFLSVHVQKRRRKPMIWIPMQRFNFVIISLIFALAACGDDKPVEPQPDMGNDGGDSSYIDSDFAATLGSTARENLCAKIIEEVGNPGDKIDCSPSNIILPSAAECAKTLKKYPTCAKVSQVKTCLEKQLSCNASLKDDKDCKFLFFDSCGVDESVKLDKLGKGDKNLFCADLLEKAGGVGKTIKCDAGLPLTVPSQQQCVNQMTEGKACASAKQFAACYDSIYTCGEANREKCWFLIGNDSQCVPPYQGPVRKPSGFFVFPPLPVSCDAPSSLQRLPFTFLSGDGVIVPGDIVGTRSVAPNISIDAQTLTATRPRIEGVSSDACTLTSDCEAGFKCATAGDQKFCSRQTGLEFVPGSVTFDFDSGVFKEKKQLVGVLIENTSLLEGRLPTSVGGLYGEDGKKDLLTNLGRASDPKGVRKGAIANFFQNLASVTDPENTLMTLWFFAGDVPARARPLVESQKITDHFTTNLSEGSTLLNTMPTAIPRPANLYQALLSMYEKDFGLEKYKEYEKFIFVFVDGPNEVFDPEHDYKKLLEESRKLGVHLFFIHLDAAIDPTLTRDLPEFYAGNLKCQKDTNCKMNPCNTTTECQRHETCRSARVYGKTKADSVKDSPLKYCLPTYNNEGRLGPIDELADLACHTQGNYIYISDIESMSDYWAYLSTVINGQFSIQMEVSALADSALKDSYYRFDTVILGGLGNSGLSKPLRPKEGFYPDRRPLIRMKK